MDRVKRYLKNTFRKINRNKHPITQMLISILLLKLLQMVGLRSFINCFEFLLQIKV